MLINCPYNTPQHLNHVPAHILICFIVRKLLQDTAVHRLLHNLVEDNFSKVALFFLPLLQPSCHWLSLTMYPYSWSEKAWRENLSCTLFLPAFPMSLRSCGSLMSFSMALEKASAVGSHRKPVSPSATLSRGPPEFTAITGQQQYIASTGTIPKCSLLGV